MALSDLSDNPCSQAKVSEMRESLDWAQSRVDELHGVVKILGERLQPVLRPIASGEDREEDAPPTTSEYSKRLKKLGAAVSQSSRYLAELLERLEV